MSFAIKPISFIILGIILFLAYKCFIMPKIAMRKGNAVSYDGYSALKNFYVYIFYLYICCSLFFNLGFFVKIKSYEFGTEIIISFILSVLSCYFIIKGKFDKKILFLGIVLLAIDVVAIASTIVFPYSGGWISHVSMWDYYIVDNADKAYRFSFNFSVFKAAYDIIKITLILSVVKCLMPKKQSWLKLLDIIDKAVIGVIVYAFIEIGLKKVLKFDVVGKLLVPIFGDASGTFTDINRLQGLYKEASHYALYLFFFALFVMFNLILKKGDLTKKQLIIEYLKLAAIVIIMAASTSFSAVILLPLILIFFVWYIIKPKEKLVWILCFISMISIGGALLSNGALMESLGLSGISDKFNNMLSVITTLISGRRITTYSSSGARFTSIFETIKLFLARPIFGIGLGVTDAHTTFFSVLASIGIVGMVLWIAILFAFGRYSGKSLCFALILLISSMFVGSRGYLGFIIYPVLFLYAKIAIPEPKTKLVKKVVIDGSTLAFAKKLTGIERVCREIILRLDMTLAKNFCVEYIYPKGAEHNIIKPDELKNIKCVELPQKSEILALIRGVPRYVKKNNAVCVNMRVTPLFCKGNISTIHDLRPVTFKNTDSFKFRLRTFITLKVIKHFSAAIITVSDYQKREIEKYFKIKDGSKPVYTIYNGWEHLLEMDSDEAIFERFPTIKKGDFFYSLGSLAPHKNFKWVKEVAKRNPKKTFVIAGGKCSELWKDDIETNEIKNVIFTGYVSDGENKALMSNCKAFIFPSIYEGFGIPPIEAMLCGAPVLCSNASCMPEIYEDTVRYFDPYDYDVDLDGLLANPVANSEKIFKKCSWDTAAEKWQNVIIERINKKNRIGIVCGDNIDEI